MNIRLENAGIFTHANYYRFFHSIHSACCSQGSRERPWPWKITLSAVYLPCILQGPPREPTWSGTGSPLRYVCHCSAHWATQRLGKKPFSEALKLFEIDSRRWHLMNILTGLGQVVRLSGSAFTPARQYCFSSAWNGCDRSLHELGWN